MDVIGLGLDHRAVLGKLRIHVFRPYVKCREHGRRKWWFVFDNGKPQRFTNALD